MGDVATVHKLEKFKLGPFKGRKHSGAKGVCSSRDCGAAAEFMYRDIRGYWRTACPRCAEKWQVKGKKKKVK